MLETARRSLPVPDVNAARFLYKYELARIAVEQERYADAARFAASALAAPTRDPELLPWLCAGLARVAKAQDDLGDAKAYAAAAVSLTQSPVDEPGRRKLHEPFSTDASIVTAWSVCRIVDSASGLQAAPPV
jgi:hypothetical protein